MKYEKITNKKTGEMLISFDPEDFERVNPIKHHKDFFIVKNMLLKGISLAEIKGQDEISEIGKQAFIDSIQLWNEKLNEINNTDIPSNLISLFSTNKKKSQEKLLKDVEMNPKILIAFIFKAYSDFGFTLSQYKSHFSQKGIDASKMPFAYEVENEKVNVFGKTELSDGQLKQAIKHRKVKIANFLDKENNWHCFFTTFKSLRGEETYLDENQPHFHYISDYFGIPREKVVSELKSEKYNLGSLPHIKFQM